MLSIKIHLANSIKQIFSICFLVISLFSFSVLGQEQKAPESQVLTANQTIERELSGGQTHNYKITLKANEFVHIKAEQKGVDIVVTLISPNNQKLIEVDSPNGTQGLEVLSYITEESGSYTLEIKMLTNDAPLGKYSVQLSAQRVPTDSDRKRIQAETLINKATMLQGQKKAESLRQAVEILKQAVVLWSELEDREQNANSLRTIGSIHQQLKEFQKSLDYYNQAVKIYRDIGNKNNEALLLLRISSIYFSEFDEPQKGGCQINCVSALSPPGIGTRPS